MEKQQNHHNPQTTHQQQQRQTWGTWEELLLASAVKRHGFKDWDTVAMEVQTRTTLPQLLTTPHNCEQKFHDLKRRFTPQCNDDVPEAQENGTRTADKVDHVPWLDELRKLRVAELRQEVQRSDVSILSLKLKVKKLEEERERSLKENDGKEDEKPDLDDSDQPKPGNDKKGGDEKEAQPADSEPVRDESDRENQSVNESNSTGSRSQGGKNGEVDEKLEPLPVQASLNEPGPVDEKIKPVGEESNNGSYDNTARVPTCESVPPSAERKVEDSSELRDSVAHSREGEAGTRESSDVQSSASLTRKRKTRRKKEVSGGDGGGSGSEEPPENDAVAMRSQPLFRVLELIKGHEHSSLFQRRLESQESDKYKNIVRQHMDLETIQTRLRKGGYCSCTQAFFRDLLLVFSNAAVFFPKDSIESRAAQQLRRLVSNEFKTHIQSHSDPLPRKLDHSLQPKPPQAKPDSLLSKHKAPIVVCRKRTPISPKPSSATIGQKGDQPSNERKPASESKPPLKPSSSDSDEEPPKAKEKPVTGVRSLRRSNKNIRSNPGKKLQSSSTSKSGSGNNKSETPKSDKSKAEAGSDKKRSAAADFLKRIKRNGPAEGVRSGGGGNISGGRGGNSGKDQKKVTSSGKNDKGRERASRHSSGTSDRKNENENSNQSKRSVGRPPKKAAETHAVSAKRGRDSGGGGKDKRPKKRSKK